MRSPMSTYEIQVKEQRSGQWNSHTLHVERGPVAPHNRNGPERRKKKIKHKQTFASKVCSAIRAGVRANERTKRKRKKKVSIFFLFYNEPLISNAGNKCDDITTLRRWWCAPHGWPLILVRCTHFELCQQRRWRWQTDVAVAGERRTTWKTNHDGRCPSK